MKSTALKLSLGAYRHFCWSSNLGIKWHTPLQLRGLQQKRQIMAAHRRSREWRCTCTGWNECDTIVQWNTNSSGAVGDDQGKCHRVPDWNFKWTSVLETAGSTATKKAALFCHLTSNSTSSGEDAHNGLGQATERHTRWHATKHNGQAKDANTLREMIKNKPPDQV